MGRFLLFSFFFSFVFFSPTTAQERSPAKKYPSLFWEITGNGLKKPSYLFGTMHVSSKTVFHLSDSFYQAIRNTDAVALELNPAIWQEEMFRLQKAQQDIVRFTSGKMNDYLKESSFRIDRYEENIKKALVEEPTIVNNLLYRSYQSSADFEENTYLDLYIYQTGRKLGKRGAGVENYVESERIMMEAYKDMAKDKTKRRYDDGDSYYDIQKKLQQAYRKGDLDLLDSLQNITTTSSAFSEKFLYLRNEIQANSIDTILKKQSLFASVGAAHLPGSRGVIELLRKKGYTLRPIIIQDRDGVQKEAIDKLKVPVVFRRVITSDGTVEFKLPGNLYRREEAKGNESWQYADMDNGSYYMLTRVRTHAPLLGHSENVVFRKVDSMLYENIPGKILNKTEITVNGYKGFDITNRTRRGDLQRYRIVVTPFEVLVFKMSGNDSYVDGNEAKEFFESIKIKPETNTASRVYSPIQGGFKVALPRFPNEAFSKNTADGIERWDYEAVDPQSGNAFSIKKKSVYNFNFIEEDTFDLELMDESVKSSEIIMKQMARKVGYDRRLPFIESKYLLKDGAYLYTKALINGPHYYLLSMRTKNKHDNAADFFKSFQFTDYRYPEPARFIDSSLKFEVMTSVKPDLDTMLRGWMEKSGNEGVFSSAVSYTNWPKNKTGVFRNDSTGESIHATVMTFPKYYYSKDSAKFWRERLEEKENKDLIYSKKDFFRLNDSICGYDVVLTDTNSTRSIRLKYFLTGEHLYKFSTITDTSARQSSFIKNFFATVKPLEIRSEYSVFKNKVEEFFTDYNSPDSAATKQAAAAIPSVYFGKEGVDKIIDAIDKLKYGSPDYLEVKSRFITELGYINDSTVKDRIVNELKTIYEKTADTAYFQNPVLTSLARLQTAASFRLFKELLVQDPPVFDNANDYERLFNRLTDTLSLSKLLFPEILQLASIEDYKPYVNTLLRTMVDSGYMKANDYEGYFSRLYFDARMELKKQQIKDEKLMEVEDGADDEDNGVEYRNIYSSNVNNPSTSTIRDYAVLLMPFYDTHSAVPKFLDRMLRSKDVNVQLIAVQTLISNNKKIPDSLLQSIALQDRYRAKLLSMLEKINRKELFPAKLMRQELIAKALLLNDKNHKEFADIQLVDKRTMEYKGSKGLVYIFKYKINKDDDWKIGVSGLQPLKTNEVTASTELVKLTDKKLKSTEPELKQVDEQLKKLLYSQHKGGQRFFEQGNMWEFSNDD